MLVEHRGKQPTVHPSAYVAPTAVVCGDVRIGEDARILFGAVVTAEDGFVATGVGLFLGCVIGAGAEVRIHGVVQVNSRIQPGAVVPIGWVAVGDEIHPPGDHEAIWATQRELDFPGTVYGIERGTDATTLMRRQSDFYGAHSDDKIL